MGWLKVDDWWEMIIVGLVILGSLYIILLIIRQFFNNGGKVKTKNIEIEQQEKLNPPCFDYVAGHTLLLNEMKNTLITMEKERKLAREENSETNKTTQTMFKTLARSMDGLIEAFQKNNIGNGNLEKARKGLAKMYDIQDGYLINQL
jgi:ABC-type transport system involved in cytochrome bd biosynthesis fused ATPase/permease subunit